MSLYFVVDHINCIVSSYISMPQNEVVCAICTLGCCIFTQGLCNSVSVGILRRITKFTNNPQFTTTIAVTLVQK